MKSKTRCACFLYIYFYAAADYWPRVKNTLYPWSKLNTHTHRVSMHHGNWLTLPTSCMSCSCLSCDRVWCLRASWRAVSPSLSAMFRLQPSRTNSWTKNKNKTTQKIYNWGTQTHTHTHLFPSPSTRKIQDKTKTLPISLRFVSKILRHICIIHYTKHRAIYTKLFLLKFFCKECGMGWRGQEWTALFDTRTICVCCRSTARCRGVCRLTFCMSILALPCNSRQPLLSHILRIQINTPHLHIMEEQQQKGKTQPLYRH